MSFIINPYISRTPYYTLLSTYSTSALWKCGESSGTTLADSAGSNPMTMVGTGVGAGTGPALGTIQTRSIALSSANQQLARPATEQNSFRLLGDRTYIAWGIPGTALAAHIFFEDADVNDFKLLYQGTASTNKLVWLTNGQTVISNSTYANNALMMVALTFTFSSSLAKLYVNGVLDNSGTTTPGNSSTAANDQFTLGGNTAVSDWSDMTSLGAVSIHPIVMTSTDILNLYNAGI